MPSSQEAELLKACRHLFPHAEVGRAFLSYIEADGLKNAYRNRVREFHPDTCPHPGDHLRHTESFRHTVDAYKLLEHFLKNRKPHKVRHEQQARGERPAFTQAAKREKNLQEQYFDGPFPTIELKFGLFLYYSTLVSYQDVVRALIWQRALRPPLGDFARQWGWLSDADVSVILAATEISGSFGDRAVAVGLLTQSQLNLLLLHQRSLQQPLGSYFVDQSILTEYELKKSLRDQAAHNMKIRESKTVLADG